MANRLTGSGSTARIKRGWPKTAKMRIHLDVQVDDIGAARRQVERLGGRWSGERHDYDEGVVMVMHDPEGREFCLVQYHN